jgi:hypothetical protein
VTAERPARFIGYAQEPIKRNMKVLLRPPAAAPANMRMKRQDRSFLMYGSAPKRRNGPEKGKSPREILSHRDLSRWPPTRMSPCLAD